MKTRSAENIRVMETGDAGDVECQIWEEDERLVSLET